MADNIDEITHCILNNIPVRFCKYGDGEHFCAIKYSHNIHYITNCDNDTYTRKLSNGIRESFNYITSVDNTFIGKWQYNPDTVKYWEDLASKPVNWVAYHTMLFEPNDLEDDNRFQHKTKIYKAVKESKLKKIIICNQLLIKTKNLLNLDHVVIIALNNWFDTQFDTVINEVRQLIGPQDGNHIILTACGMSAKVVIAELHKTHPKGIYLDIGSGLDCLCTKKDSRGWGYKYDQISTKFKEHNFLPQDWEHPKYNFIYNEAKNKLGIHLPK
jgi:hypothetical protein